jgi:hypothetical protein
MGAVGFPPTSAAVNAYGRGIAHMDGMGLKVCRTLVLK